ncbi:hypothetical protein PO909_026391 [Leuciscus waleckii]
MAQSDWMYSKSLYLHNSISLYRALQISMCHAGTATGQKVGRFLWGNLLAMLEYQLDCWPFCLRRTARTIHNVIFGQYTTTQKAKDDRFTDGVPARAPRLVSPRR